MLHQMCHEVLADADVRAICKNRGLPKKAASSHSMLEAVFLSDTGVADAMRRLDRSEIALLHLLRSQDKPVDVAFFSNLDMRPKAMGGTYGTFTQRFQGVFAKVKDRLVRKGNPPSRAQSGNVSGEEDQHGKVAVCPAGAIGTPPATAG